MADTDIKISQLSGIQVVNDADVFPIVSGSVTSKVSARDFKEYTIGDTDNSGLGENVSAQIQKIAKGGDIILISASYGVTPSATDNCMVYLEQLLDGIYDHVYTSAISGASFTDGRYLSQLQTLASTITNKGAVKDIVVIGHGNDSSATAENLVTAMIEFSTYAMTTFPNAKLSVAPVSVEGSAVGARARFNTTNTMLINMYQHKMSIMTDLNHILALDYDTYTGADKWHPSTAGARLIAMGIFNILVNGSYNRYIMKDDRNPSNKTFSSDFQQKSGTYFIDEVTTDIHTMTASVVVSFEALGLTHFSSSWGATKFMTCNPLFRGMKGDDVIGARSFMGTIVDMADPGNSRPIRLSISRDDTDGKYWYYPGMMDGQDYVMTAGHSYTIRAFGSTPFMLN
jgi:hypothetical protein